MQITNYSRIAGTNGERGSTGAEARWVDQLLRLGLPFGDDVYVFREPTIDGRYPDLLVVRPDRAKLRRIRDRATAWGDCSHHFSHLPEPELDKRGWSGTHFSVLTTLYLLGGSGTIDQIAERCWFAPSTIKRALCSLRRANRIIMQRNGTIKLRSTAFIVRSIITIEAKLYASRGLIYQALINATFATESFVAVPFGPRRVHSGPQQCHDWGIGWMDVRHNTVRCTPPAEPHRLKQPVNWVSWLINEMLIGLLRTENHGERALAGSRPAQAP